jgi:hemerythrin-like domain-containing protein
MDPIRVNEILAAVREEHELLAEQMRVLEELKRTFDGVQGPHFDRTINRLRGASQFFQTKLLPHLDEEERGLFLLFHEYLPKGSTLVYELEAEHAQMRDLCERLRAEVALVRHEKHRRAPVISDLRSLCDRIGNLLARHADRENAIIEHLLKSIACAEPCERVPAKTASQR